MIHFSDFRFSGSIQWFDVEYDISLTSDSGFLKNSRVF